MSSVHYSVAATLNLFDSEEAEEANLLELLQKIALSPAVASQNNKTTTSTSGEHIREATKHNKSGGGQKGGDGVTAGNQMRENVRPKRNTDRAAEAKPRLRWLRKNREVTDVDIWNLSMAASFYHKTDGQANHTTRPDADQTENNVDTTDEEQARRELTLDEWRAMKGPKKSPTYNIRQAGEGEDLTQWKMMFALGKKREITDEDEYEYINQTIPQRVGRLKRITVDFRFADNRRSSGDSFRGGRGRGSEGSRGDEGISTEYRQGVSAPGVPKVYDERDFPSL